MLVRWGYEHIAGVPLVSKESGLTRGGEKIVVLHPGWNEVTPEAWPMLFEHLQDKIANGNVEFYGVKEKNEAGETIYKDQPMEAVRADKARDIVQDCLNYDNLIAWQGNAKLSSEVRHLVDMQIEKISK